MKTFLILAAIWWALACDRIACAQDNVAPNAAVSVAATNSPATQPPDSGAVAPNGPVSVAVNALLQPESYECRMALDVLVTNWMDPRSEPALEALSRKGPHRMGELGATIYGRAANALHEVRGLKAWDPIVKGKKSQAERTPAILAYVQEHPEVIPPATGNYYLRRFIFGELAKSDDTNAIRMVLKSGELTDDFAKRHFKEILKYMEEMKPEEAIENASLVEWLCRSRNPEVIPLFEKMIPFARTSGSRTYLESAVKHIRNPRLADED